MEQNQYDDRLCFANHLFVPMESEPQLKSRKMYSGKKIPKRIINEIHIKAENLKKFVTWKKNDLVMLDNIRFMHGRQTIDVNENQRDIITIQTARSKIN